MKYYETSFEEHLQSKNNFDIHPELKIQTNKLPKNINQLNNLILYGPSGSGKYSTALDIINKYSHNDLKYDKRTTVYTEKGNFNLKISDIHYEVDISLLGCNSKQLWHEIFFKIVDIISIQKDKEGIILCKNFQNIHSELLDIFYSYIQQYNHSQANIKIVFIIITEQISFIPFQIIQTSQVINIKKPSQKLCNTYLEISNNINNNKKTQEDFSKYIHYQEVNKKYKKNKNKLIQEINTDNILNLKELKSFPLIEKNKLSLPTDNFNVICDKIIREINDNKNINYTEFRDNLYDILTYGLDINECLWYIISYYIDKNMLSKDNVSNILVDCYSFLKYYNNNYRPIYHLENIFYILIQNIRNLNEIK